MEEQRAQHQEQAKEEVQRDRKEKERKEKEKKEKEQRKSLSRGAESGVTEPVSKGTVEKKVEKPKPAKPASASGGSAASTSKGSVPATPAVRTEPAWKSSWEMMEYLNALHGQLYSSPKARELKARISELYKSFHAQERLRKNSYLQGRELTQNQISYSRKKKRLHKQWAAEDHSQLQEFEWLAIGVEDDDRYDTAADDKSNRLEQALEREKASQTRWKEEHRRAMEAREKRLVVSQKQQSEKFTELTRQLNYSEGNAWKDQYRAHDQAQLLRTGERHTHYFVQQRGHMDRSHALYSRRKQSQYQRFMESTESAKWEDRESTSEYDTDIDNDIEKLTDELQAMVQVLHDLQAQQQPEAGGTYSIGNACAADGSQGCGGDHDGARPAGCRPNYAERHFREGWRR